MKSENYRRVAWIAFYAWAIIMFLLLATSCAGAAPKGPRTSLVSNRLERIVDAEAGVVCYAWPGRALGLSCLPISETTLDMPTGGAR